jgi:hypothetical protein
MRQGDDRPFHGRPVSVPVEEAVRGVDLIVEVVASIEQKLVLQLGGIGRAGQRTAQGKREEREPDPGGRAVHIVGFVKKVSRRGAPRVVVVTIEILLEIGWSRHL